MLSRAVGVVGEIETKALYGLAGIPDAVIAKHISAPGKLGLPKAILPPMLEARRWPYFIPDQAFDIMPASDTVHVWQIGRPRATYSEGGVIVMSEQARDQHRNESPRGILVSAGLLALDQLRSHGMDLGHIVYLLRLSPYRLPMDMIAHRESHGLLVLHAGDIKGSEDTMAMLRSGELRIERVKETIDGVETERHVYIRKTGEELKPIRPWAPEET